MLWCGKKTLVNSQHTDLLLCTTAHGVFDLDRHAWHERTKSQNKKKKRSKSAAKKVRGHHADMRKIKKRSQPSRPLFRRPFWFLSPFLSFSFLVFPLFSRLRLKNPKRRPCLGQECAYKARTVPWPRRSRKKKSLAREKEKEKQKEKQKERRKEKEKREKCRRAWRQTRVQP